MEECLESKLDKLSPGCRAMFEEPENTPQAAPVGQNVQATVPAHASPPASP
ncbi:hypothetical protein LDL36_10340 [Komagataeibacter sp. FNDCR1]|nr:hypothetical protein [Komagataeibacter sp. FNDCR1]